MLSNQTIKEKLIQKFGEQVFNFEEPYGMLTFERKKIIPEVMQYLSTMRNAFSVFDGLTACTPIRYSKTKNLRLSITFTPVDNIRIRSKYLHRQKNPSIYTTKLFSSANWMERETLIFTE